MLRYGFAECKQQYISVSARVCVRLCVCVIESLGSTPARLGQAVSLDLISHSGELLCGTGAYGLKKKKEFFLPLCHCFTEGPYSLGAPRKAVPYSSYPQHFAPACLSRFIRDGFGAVHHLTYEYRDALGGRVSWMNHLHSAKITV